MKHWLNKVLKVSACIAGLSLAARLEAQQAVSPVQIEKLVAQLGDDSFARREAASEELGSIGELALPALHKAAASSDDLEIRARADIIAAEITVRLLAARVKQEIEGLQGDWYSTSVNHDGALQQGENRADRHIFSGNQWAYKNGDGLHEAGKFNIVEVGERFVKMNFVVTSGTRAGDTWAGIYERRGDELKWCGGYLGDGVARPIAFATKPGDGYFLRTLRRDKK
jgi:uncharacterized protein (TIGR03067 family)